MNQYDSNRIYDLTSNIGFQKTDIKKKSWLFRFKYLSYKRKGNWKSISWNRKGKKRV